MDNVAAAGRFPSRSGRRRLDHAAQAGSTPALMP